LQMIPMRLELFHKPVMIVHTPQSLALFLNLLICRKKFSRCDGDDRKKYFF
jgi:hypothetical protein